MSAVGEQMFGESAALTGMANTTINSAYAGFGIPIILPLIISGGVVLSIATVFMLKKSQPQMMQERKSFV